MGFLAWFGIDYNVKALQASYIMLGSEMLPGLSVWRHSALGNIEALYIPWKHIVCSTPKSSCWGVGRMRGGFIDQTRVGTCHQEGCESSRRSYAFHFLAQKLLPASTTRQVSNDVLSPQTWYHRGAVGHWSINRGRHKALADTGASRCPAHQLSSRAPASFGDG